MEYATDTSTADKPPASSKDAGGIVESAFARLNSLIVFVSSIAMVMAVLVLTYSVVTRYFLHLSTDWQDELSVFLIIGAVFMSSAAIQAQRGHVAIEAIVGLLGPRINAVRQVLVDIASMTFCGYFAWKCWTLLAEAWTENYHSESTWGPPLWVPYSLMSVGMTLLSLQLLLQVIDQLVRRARP
jgi:TRAP-type C4-dicarboxylate transport system permease small subunit